MTRKRVALRSSAARDVEAILMWYAASSESTARRFLLRLDRALTRLPQWPERFAVCDPTTSLRRAPVRGFPFFVYYRVRPNEVEVVAVLHGRRAR